jgi:WD40 repeat protein
VSAIAFLPLLAVLAASPSSSPPPVPGPQLRAVLGQPDLAAPARIRVLTFVEAGTYLLAEDASGTAQLWDVKRAERRGLVFGPVVLTPSGLKSAPPGKGCLLEGPLARLPDARFGRATEGSLRLCDLTGSQPETHLRVPALSEDGMALAFSADGTVVAQGTAFGEVVRAATDGSGEPLRIQAHEGEVLAVQLDAKGQLLTAGADGAVRTFDAQGRRVRSVDVLPQARRFRGTGCEGETPLVAAFNQDGSALLLGTTAGDGLAPCPEAPVPAHLRLAELPSGKVRWELRGVQVSAATFGSQGELAVAVALRPGEPGDANPSTVVRLDPKTGAALDKPAGHRAPITVMRFSPDGSTLASGDASGTWKTWALDSGREASSASQPDGAILDIQFTKDLHVLTQHEDDGVRQWQKDGKLLSVLVPPPASDPAGRSPACRAEEEKLHAALAGMKPHAAPLPVRDPDRYSDVTMLPELALAADGQSVLAPVAEESCVTFSRNGCPQGCHRSYHLARVDLHTGKTLQELDVDEELLGGCVPPAGAFVTRDDRAGMNLWAASGTLTGRIGVVLGKVSACEATPDGKKMLVATPRSLSVWDAAAFSAPVQAVPRRAQAPGPVAFSPRGDLSVDVDGGELRLRHWPKGTFVARLALGPHDDAPTAMAFTPDAQTLAVGTARGVIYLYNLPGDGQTAHQLN